MMGGTTWYLHGDNNALVIEKELKANGVTENRHFLQAAGMTFALVTTRSGTGVSSTTSDLSKRSAQVRYFHQDHLNSMAVITDEVGQVVERLAYDPWGKRRNANGLADKSDSLVGQTTDRGYTEHEHLDEVGLIHMNGRVYDPLIGRFMSADPFIQSPGNLQSYNRYAYVMNNPLALTDPSGYWSLKKFFRAAVTIAVAYYTGGAVAGWYEGAAAATTLAGGSAFTIAGAGGISGTAAIVGGAAGGFAAGVTGAALNGANLSQSLQAGLQGGLTGALFGAAGGVGSDTSFARYAAHAGAGCVSSVAGGGSCGQGAASAVFGKFTTNAIGGVDANTSIREVIAKGVATAVAGGVGSAIAGGKFANGAETAAYGYLFNELLHVGDRRSAMLRAGYNDGGSTRPYDPPLEGFYPEGYLLGTGGAISAAGASLKVAFSGGANSVFWSGYSLGALEAAGSFGTTLEKTVGGRFLSWMDHSVGIKVPDSVWNWASSTFANNATGTAQAVIRAEGRVWTTIEKPILQRRGIPVELRP